MPFEQVSGCHGEASSMAGPALITVPVRHGEVCGLIAVYPDRVEWPGERVPIPSVTWVAVQSDLALSTLVIVADRKRTDFRLTHDDAGRLRDVLCKLVLAHTQVPAAAASAVGLRRGARTQLRWRCVRAS
jgi:hypothetical protein